MAPRSPLDDPTISAHVWGRFRRQLKITGWIALAAEIVVLSTIYAGHGMVSIHVYIGLALAIALGLFLISGLMGLVFLSHGTGHDDAVADQRGYRKRP